MHFINSNFVVLGLAAMAAIVDNVVGAPTSSLDERDTCVPNPLDNSCVSVPECDFTCTSSGNECAKCDTSVPGGLKVVWTCETIAAIGTCTPTIPGVPTIPGAPIPTGL
ncbi:hypothetical protein C8T65DRAFT_740368 [Cerioporus squamosus]|nr:hypothetical protein C8T65DRAFT_740368 [Cerioporus squamosus]